MKLIEIPENTNELRDYNKFIHTIVEVQKFNRNVNSFLKKTLKDEFFKPFKVWYESASEKDKKQLNKFKFGKPKIIVDAFEHYRDTYQYDKEEALQKIWDEDKSKNKHSSKKYKLIIDNPNWDKNIFYCYETNTFIKPNSENMTRFEYFYNSMSCEPTNDGLGIIVILKTSYKEWSFPTNLPTYHIKLKYQIDLLSKSVKKISDTKTETSNKNY